MGEALYFATRTGVESVMLPWPTLARAKRLMRAGRDLHETALILGIRSRDLDVSLWRAFDEGGW